MARNLLWASLALGPLAIVVHWGLDAGGTVDFALSSAALVPLAWLIGEATEHAARHTGAGIGGFLNATFGNAPELIIALFAVHEGLFEVVRGSLTGSVVGNLLLVLGFSLAFGPAGRLDRQSTYVSLRRHQRLHVSDEATEMAGWSLWVSIAVLGVATAITAVIAEILVGSIEEFADKLGLSDFFVAAVIVAIVGNAAEHGGAVVVARRGNIRLAAEIALASSAQVAVFLIPAVALLSWLIEPLALSFRAVELGVLFGAVAVTALLLADGRASKPRGIVLIGAYAAAAAAFYAAGDR